MPLDNKSHVPMTTVFKQIEDAKAEGADGIVVEDIDSTTQLALNGYTVKKSEHGFYLDKRFTLRKATARIKKNILGKVYISW